MNVECEFCKKNFSSKSNLYTHQNTAKYCLELQGSCSEKEFKCDFCNKQYAQKKGLLLHVSSCKEREKKVQTDKDNEQSKLIKKLESEIIRLKRTEKENIKNVIEEKSNYYEEKIKEKNDYISKLEANIEKLEARLEKFEDSILSKTDNKPVPQEESIPIPLKEQMSSIIIEDIKEDDTVNYSMITLNNVSITSRPIDHYVNATQLCQAGGKKFNDWIRLESTKELIDELSAEAGIPVSAFVDTKRGGNNKSDQGSWIHPDLSIQLAQWISPKFAIQVSKWVRTLFNKGSVEIDLNLLREKERDIRIKDHLIKELKAVCLSKQRRIEYPEKNVIYLLTTEDHLKRRTYIIGKAKNLTTRLGTYNKTCDHTVVYYKECKGEDDMDTVETMVLSKLRDYREKANRDRFILPEDKEISFFIGIIDECIRFIG
jgi:KilA-N domain/Meiotically up-regulated gene 113/Zinc finger, C2H2 type